MRSGCHDDGVTADGNSKSSPPPQQQQSNGGDDVTDGSKALTEWSSPAAVFTSPHCRVTSSPGGEVGLTASSRDASSGTDYCQHYDGHSHEGSHGHVSHEGLNRGGWVGGATEQPNCIRAAAPPFFEEARDGRVEAALAAVDNAAPVAMMRNVVKSDESSHPSVAIDGDNATHDGRQLVMTHRGVGVQEMVVPRNDAGGTGNSYRSSAGLGDPDDDLTMSNHSADGLQAAPDIQTVAEEVVVVSDNSASAGPIIQQHAPSGSPVSTAVPPIIIESSTSQGHAMYARDPLSWSQPSTSAEAIFSSTTSVGTTCTSEVAPAVNSNLPIAELPIAAVEESVVQIANSKSLSSKENNEIPSYHDNDDHDLDTGRRRLHRRVLDLEAGDLSMPPLNEDMKPPGFSPPGEKSSCGDDRQAEQLHPDAVIRNEFSQLSRDSDHLSCHESDVVHVVDRTTTSQQEEPSDNYPKQYHQHHHDVADHHKQQRLEECSGCTERIREDRYIWVTCDGRAVTVRMVDFAVPVAEVLFGAVQMDNFIAYCPQAYLLRKPLVLAQRHKLKFFALYYEARRRASAAVARDAVPAGASTEVSAALRDYFSTSNAIARRGGATTSRADSVSQKKLRITINVVATRGGKIVGRRVMKDPAAGKNSCTETDAAVGAVEYFDDNERLRVPGAVAANLQFAEARKLHDVQVVFDCTVSCELGHYQMRKFFSKTAATTTSSAGWPYSIAQLTSVRHHPRDADSVRVAAGADCEVGTQRTTMEDRSSCIRDLHVACGHPAPPKSETVSYFAVFDGHLGDATAEFLEKNMYAFFFDALREVESYGLAANDRELLAAAMQRAFELAEARVHDLAKRTVQQQTPSVVPASACEAQINYTSGSTACVLAIRGNCITIANLGDSRCILSRGGRPHTITLDHRLLDPATVRLSSSSSSPTACADDSTSAPYLASKRITDASPATCRRCDRPCAKVGRIPRAIPRLLHSSPSTSVHVPQVFPSSATDPRPPHRGNEAGGSAGQHAGQNQQGTGLVHGQHQHHQRAAQLHTKRDGLQHLHERYSSSSSSSSSSSAAVSAATTSIQSPQQNILAATTSDTNSSSSFSAVSPPPPPPLHFYSGGRNSSHFPSSGLPASAPPRLTPPSASPPAPSSSFSSPSASPIAPLHHPDTRPRLHSQNPPSSSSSSSSPSEHHRLHQDKESSQFVPRHHHLYSHSHDNPAPLVQLLASGTASSRRNSGGTNPGGRGGDSYLSIPDDSRSADDNSEQHRHERDSGASASAASMPLVQKLPLDDNEAVALECREAVEATSNLPPRPPSSLSTTSFPFGDLNFASSSSSAIHQHLSTPNEEPTVPVGEKAAECRKFELPAVTTDCANVGASADIEKIATGSPSETVEDTAGNGGSVNTAGKKKEGVSCRRAGDKAPNAEAQSQMSSGGAPSGVRIRKIGEEKKGKRGVPPAGRRSTRRRRGASNVGSEKDVVKGAAAIREINRRVMAEVTRLTPPILTELERITEDEQKVQACREYLRVTESTKGHVDAKYLNGVLSVSRAIGDYNKLKFGKLEGLSAVPDIYQLFLRPEDEFLVLTCDGVTDVLSESDIVKCVRNELMKKGKNPRDAAQKLIKRAMLSPTENVTAVVVAISQDESDLKTSSTAGSCQNVAVHDPWNADSRSRVFVNGSAVAPPAVAAQPKAPNRVRKKITYPTADALMADC